MADNRVYLDKCTDYNIDKLISIFRKRFAELGVDKQIKEGMKVVIKPNLIMRTTPESGAITHPNVTAAVGILVKEYGASVLIAESSGGIFTEQSVKSVMNGCGYSAIAEKYGFEIYTECKNTLVDIPNGTVCKSMNIIDPYINADYVIDIAKLKSHCMTMLSGSVKNLFGVVPGLMKPELHFRFPEKEDFSQMLVDLCEYIKPDLCIIDGIVAMEGDGPTGGNPKNVGALLVGNNPYVLDVTAATLIGMNPMDVIMLKKANECGLCPVSVSDVEIIGENLETLTVKDFKMPRTKSVDFAHYCPKFIRPMVKRITTPKPVIKTAGCIGCGKCAESCPRHTIKIENRKAIIDYSNCIRCFCCHEMCPMHTIDVRRFSVFKI